MSAHATYDTRAGTGTPPSPERVPPRSVLQIARRLWSELAAVRGRFVQTVVAGLLAQCAIAVGTILLAVMVGRVIGGDGGPDVGMAVALAAAAVVAGAATWWEMYVSHDLAYLVMAGMRVRLHHRIRRIVPSRRDQRHSGDLAAAAMSDVETMEWVFAHVFGQVLTSLVMIVAAGIGLTLADPVLCWVLAGAALIVLSVPWWWRTDTDRRADEQRRAAADLSSDVLDTVQGIAVLAAAGSLSRRIADHDRDSRRLDRWSVRLAVRSGWEAAATDLCVGAAGLVGLLVVVDAVRSGAVPIAEVPVILAWFGLALAPLAAVAGALRNIGTTRSAGNRLADVLDTPDTVPAAPARTHNPDAAGDPVALEFRGVRFGYDPAAPVLHDVGLCVRRGEVVGIAGRSGAGKSTLVALAQRFYDPDAGSVLLGGTDLRHVPDDELRQRVAVVSQKVDVLTGTVRENLVLGLPAGHPGRTEDGLRTAAEQSHLSEVLDRLPGGLDEPLGERGSTLSGGEQARVALARALVRRPDVLILDEVVAGLDAVLEQQVMAAVRERAGSAAALVIAHRPSSLALCDRVVVLDDGRARD